MKVVIIGNGVAGIFTAQNIRNLDQNVEIEIYGEEEYPYYTRIKLPEFLSGHVEIHDLTVYKEEWYKERNIKTVLSKRVEKINPKQKQIVIQGETKPVSYDKLIIATGSTPNIPPIKNAAEFLGKGVFTLRSIFDARKIIKYIRELVIKKTMVIGGGLLG